MLLLRRLPLAALIEFCRVTRISLSAGLMLTQVAKHLTIRGSHRLRPVAERISQRLAQGTSFAAALEPEKALFPPLLLGLADVGEQTGHLPEVMHELENYYTERQKNRRQLQSKSILPLIQLGMAICLITAVIYILGVIAGNQGGAVPAVLGLKGAGGAIAFLVVNVGAVVAVYLGYLLLTRALGKKALVDRVVLGIPMIGRCVQALVLGRFALAMQLTLDSAMPVAKAMRLSLQATGNSAFAQQEEDILHAVNEGKPLHFAIGRGRLMPAEFVDMIAIAEEGGRVVEMMKHQSAHYLDEANRRMATATKVASTLVWLVYAMFATAVILHMGSLVFGRVFNI